MTLRLHNTLNRTIQDFVPLNPPIVKMYVCGPTVYDDPHIGHLRSAYVFDVLRRYLKFRKFDVRFVRNITDVDDKIIERVREQKGERSAGCWSGDMKAACLELSERYLRSYHDALARLEIEPPTEEPRATVHVIPDMTDFISKLLIEGAAYESGQDVYFSVRKFARYGQLSNRTVDELRSGARIEPDEAKRDPMDFALWKSAKPGEPSWNSPWGEGRPGWHIECSTMSTKYLGESFDIHGGGVDLVFPHHENEIAQAQAAGKPFAKYWVHNGLLTVNGEKMSKSLGNFVTVDDALTLCGGEVDVLKLFFLGTHYRSPIDYAITNIKAAKKRLDSLYHFFLFAQAERGSTNDLEEVPGEVVAIEEEFERSMDDDLNTPNALAALDRLANLGYQWEIDLKETGSSEKGRQLLRGKMVAAARTLGRLGEALGFKKLGSKHAEVELPSEIKELVRQREDARKEKDFDAADRIRKDVQLKGFIIEDTSGGPVVLPER